MFASTAPRDADTMSSRKLESEASIRRRLLLEPEAVDDDLPTAWTCSYVMSSGDGINLLGTLDVDRNRARFVANSGLFGTAYQFVMPRDQIQIVRVPTASTPYNALELHTKYRQNILCDFDDNVATFRRCCEVMKLDVLPQDEPLIAVLPTDVSDHANRWRQRAAQTRREREAAEALAARGGLVEDDGEQLTKQVMHLHGEKLALQKRMTELERENKHLCGEVEVLYSQVDEQSERASREREALEAAASAAVDSMLAVTAENERNERKERLSKEQEEASSPGSATSPDSEKQNKNEVNEVKVEKYTLQYEPTAVVSVPDDSLDSAITRQDELASSVAALREEKESFEREIQRLRAELLKRDEERFEAGKNDTPASPTKSTFSKEDDDNMQDMLAMEVTRLLAKQTELASHLAKVQREKELLEKENELLYRKTEQVETEVETVKIEKDLACERLSQVSRAASSREGLGFLSENGDFDGTSDMAPNSPPRWTDKPTLNQTKQTSAKGKKKLDDGPDAELAAKLIKRLETGGESEEATQMRLEMGRMKSELEQLKSQADAQSLRDDDLETSFELLEESRVAIETLEREKQNAEREKEQVRKDLLRKELELKSEKDKIATATAQAAQAAAQAAILKEKEEALWRVTEAELRAADAERAVEALRMENESSVQKVRELEDELKSERSRSKANSCASTVDEFLKNSKTPRGGQPVLEYSFAQSLPETPGEWNGTSTPFSDAGYSVSDKVWQELILGKESLLEAATARDAQKEDEIMALKAKLERLEKGKGGNVSAPSSARKEKKKGGSRLGSPRSPERVKSPSSVKSSVDVALSSHLAGLSLPRINTGVVLVPDRSSPTSTLTKENVVGIQTPRAEDSRSPLTKGLSAIGSFAKRFSPGGNQ